MDIDNQPKDVKPPVSLPNSNVEPEASLPESNSSQGLQFFSLEKKTTFTHSSETRELTGQNIASIIGGYTNHVEETLVVAVALEDPRLQGLPPSPTESVDNGQPQQQLSNELLIVDGTPDQELVPISEGNVVLQGIPHTGQQTYPLPNQNDGSRSTTCTDIVELQAPQKMAKRRKTYDGMEVG